MPHFAPRLAISCHKVRLAHKLIGVQLGGVNIPSSLSRAAARLCPGGRGRSVKVMASSSSKISDGQLVEEALKRLQSGNSSINAAQSLVDIGINLADPAYDKDREEVIKRARQAGVNGLVITGCCLKTSRKARKIAAEHENVYFTAGVHPHNAKNCDSETLSNLRELLSDAKCVAVGECGLDFNRNFSPPDVQEHWFDEQVKLAVELKKPLFLHNREATDRFAHILRRHTLSAPAVAHCFTGDGKELRELLDLGLHIGITGWVCDDRPDRGGFELGSLLNTIPGDKLMIETDGPYITPRTIRPSKARPRRNEPALLPFVLEKVSQYLERTPDDVAQQTTETALHFFGLNQ